VSHQNTSPGLQQNYTCDIQRDTIHYENAFRTVQMDERPFSIERARLTTQTSRKWLGDSGASSHCSANKDLFTYLEQIDETPVLTGNG